jgi:hypothetical protein
VCKQEDILLGVLIKLFFILRQLRDALLRYQELKLHVATDDLNNAIKINKHVYE